ncbi:hypothetical protein [Nostoc sp. NMS7]|nr:hypothetical protein [Nostoc sp. NMS7]
MYHNQPICLAAIAKKYLPLQKLGYKTRDFGNLATFVRRDG